MEKVPKAALPQASQSQTLRLQQERLEKVPKVPAKICHRDRRQTPVEVSVAIAGHLVLVRIPLRPTAWAWKQAVVTANCAAR